MSIEEKRITLKVTERQHRFIKDTSKPNDITQEELLGLMIDVFSANPKAIEPHIVRFRSRKAAELHRKKDIENKATKLVNALPQELQDKLLSGELDLEKLEKLLK